jgi:preprotein translocase subunit SecD
MRRTLRWRGVVVLFVVGLCLSFLVRRHLKLGLDLQGGVHLRVRPRIEEALQADTDAAVARVAEHLGTGGIAGHRVWRVDATHFAAAGLPEERARDFEAAASEAGVSFSRTVAPDGSSVFEMTETARAAARAATLTQTEEVLERRINEFGVSEASISTGGPDGAEFLIDLPGVDDVRRAREVIQARGRLELKLVEQGPAPTAEALFAGARLPDGLQVAVSPEAGARPPLYYAVKTVAPVTGADLRTARASIDEFGRPDVEFTLTASGGRAFSKLTSQNIGRTLAIVLDGQIQSVATIENTISATGRIAGSFTRQDVENLAVVLRAGALPTGLDYLEQTTIGPSLGADAVHAGVAAAAAGLALVVVFMVGFYRWSGVNATIALLCNLVILLGLMAYLGAVMTLPGIAGFVLTMGIGVDSNVLIFERIKEELEAGHAVRTAIGTGFNRVFRTLLDTHVSALLGAACLYQFGTGPIKGFAVTLAIGLFSNLFTSTFVSRWLFDATRTYGPNARLSI